MAGLIMISGKYENEDVVENVIRYVTRTRPRENRGNELFAYGGRGISLYRPIETAINQFLSLQIIYNINTRKGRRMRHEVLIFSRWETDYLMKKPDMLIEIGEMCSQIIFDAGFQVIYAIHFGNHRCGFGYHIHFAINAINFTNGKKIHMNIREHTGLERQFEGIVRECIQRFRSTLIQPFFEMDDFYEYMNGIQKSMS